MSSLRSIRPSNGSCRIFASIALLVVLFWLRVPKDVAINSGAISVSGAIVSKARPHVLGSATRAEVQLAGIADCRGYWLQGFADRLLGLEDEQNAVWRKAIACIPDRVRMLQIIAPEDLRLATALVQAEPQNAEGWFWLAEVAIYRQQLEQAVEDYHRGLEISATDGVRWLQLGNLLVAYDLSGARDAFLHACYNGDPRYNGCWLAGNLTEQQGNLNDAIKYYRLSKWDQAQLRADQLERQLGGK